MQDAHGRPSALDVAVERLEEPVAVLHRDERVEEHDRVRPLVEIAADLLLPALGAAVGGRPGRVESRPPPQPGCNLLDPHRVSILAGKGTSLGRRSMIRFRTLTLIAALAADTCRRLRLERQADRDQAGRNGRPGLHDHAEEERQGRSRRWRPARYSITVTDKSNIHNFHLRGPGVNKEITKIGFVGTKTVDRQAEEGQVHVRLRPALHDDEGQLHGHLNPLLRPRRRTVLP